MRACLLASLPLLLAGPARAADVQPELLLPSTTQAYFCWDGVAAHARAYGGSARGKLLAGEAGRTVKVLWEQAVRRLKVERVGNPLLAGLSPAELKKQHAEVEAILGLPGILARTGVVVGLEVGISPNYAGIGQAAQALLQGAEPNMNVATPRFQLTVILPGLAGIPEAKPLLVATSQVGTNTRTKTLRGREVTFTDGDSGRWASWTEGQHLVIVATSSAPEEAALRVLGAGAGITRHRLYRQLKEFRDFEVTTRGFIDGEALTRLFAWLRLVAPYQVDVLEHLGLFDLGGMRFWEGFEGEESRGVLEVEVASSRRGFLQVLVPERLKPEDLPPLPAETPRWVAGRASPRAVYEGLLGLALLARGQPSEDGGSGPRAISRQVDQLVQEVDDGIGVSTRDLFGALGDTFLTYYSPGDGLPGLGQVLAVSVKDERRLTSLLDRLGQNLARSVGPGLAYRRRAYHGAQLREFVVTGASPVTVSWTVHQGWWVLALQPQPVQGFVLRTRGLLPRWKPDARTAAALAKIPPGRGLVQVADPRPTVQLFLSAAPLLAGLAQGEGYGGMFPEPGLLPHPEAVCRHLFPNVLWTSFDGRVMRWESRDSVWIPLEEVGAEWLLLLLAS